MVSWRSEEWPVQTIRELITELFLSEPKLKTHKAVERPQDRLYVLEKLGWTTILITGAFCLTFID